MSTPHVTHDRRLQQLLDLLPSRVKRIYVWLVQPQARWVRMPLACALIAGGTLGFLPVLGLWMLPIGALLLGEDVPPVRRVTLRAVGRVMSWWGAEVAPEDGSRPPQPAGEVDTELPAPVSNSLVGHDHAALSQDQLDVFQAGTKDVMRVGSCALGAEGLK